FGDGATGLSLARLCLPRIDVPLVVQGLGLHTESRAVLPPSCRLHDLEYRRAALLRAASGRAALVGQPAWQRTTHPGTRRPYGYHTGDGRGTGAAHDWNGGSVVRRCAFPAWGLSRPAMAAGAA